MGKDTEVVHGLASGVHQAAHSCPHVFGGQPGQRSPSRAVIKEQAGPLQQQLLMHTVCQQPQWHLKEPVAAEVREPAQAGGKVLSGAAAAGVQTTSGGGRKQESSQHFPGQRTWGHLPPGLQTANFLHQGRHPDGVVPGLSLWGEETEAGAGSCKGKGGGQHCHPWIDTDPQFGVAQVEVLVQQPPQGAKCIFWVVHKEVAQLHGEDRERLGCAGILVCPPRSSAGHGTPGPTCLVKSRAAADLPAWSFLRRTPR